MANNVNIGKQIEMGLAAANMDYYYGPYDSKQAAFNKLSTEEVLAIGKTVGVIENGKIVEYWFESACDSVNDLVAKSKIPQECLAGAESTDDNTEYEDFFEYEGGQSGTTVSEVTYGDINVTLSYGKVSASGEAAAPVLGYWQAKHTTYDNGSTDTEYIRSGGSAFYTWSNKAVDGASMYGAQGSVSAPSYSGKIDRLLGTVKVQVSNNGKTGEAYCDVYQRGTGNGYIIEQEGGQYGDI